VTLADGTAFQARKMLIATGVIDHLPEIQGTGAFFGRGIFHYCDGWEMRYQPLGLRKGEESARLKRHGIAVRPEKILRFDRDGWLERIVFRSGEALAGPCS
jgi:hypothetical protein